MVRESLGKLKYQCAKVNKDAEKNRTVLRTLHKFIRITALSEKYILCLLYTSPSPRDRQKSRMPSSA